MMINKRLLTMSGESKKYIIGNVICQWAALLCNIVSIVCIGILIEHIMRGLFIAPMMIAVACVVIVMIAIRCVLSMVAAKLSYESSKKIKLVLREKIYEKLLRMGNAPIEALSESELVQISVEGVEQLEIYMGRYLPQLFYSLVAPVTLFAVVAFMNLKAAIILLLAVPLIPMSIIAVQKFAKKLLSKYWSIYTGLGDNFLDNLNGLTTLKIYDADEAQNERMNEEAEHFRKITMKVLTMQLNSITIMDLVAFGGAAAGIIIAVLEYGKGNMPFYQAFIIILLSAEFFIPMRLLGSYFHIAMNGMAASDKIFRMLDLVEPEECFLREEGQKEEDQTSCDDRAAGINVLVEAVTFAYEEGKECLKDISFEVQSGQFVSIVGPSGSGKSTVAALLRKENRGYEGKIALAGKKLTEIPERELMRQVTYVCFQSALFSGTIRDNLKIAAKDASDQQLEEVLRNVNLYDFLQTEGGLDFILKEQGSNLSGGQKQRLIIARALLHDSPMYIFDEATSNIDVESEEIILDVIKQLKGKKTVLFITHRLQQTKDSDQIIVLEQGRLVEKGTMEELISLDGSFKKMYESQRQLESYRLGDCINA